MEPDHGLRYELAGVIGPPRALAGLARAHPAARVVPLAVAELAIVPLLPELAAGVPPDTRRRAVLLTGPESGFSVLTPGMVALIETASTAGALAYVEASYVGRDGRQAAALWRAGHLAGGPWLLGSREEFSTETAPISVALRELGVVATGRVDEFVVAGLGRHRRTAEWS